MKIVILNRELRSEMQMYLTLSNRYQVEIAQDAEDLMSLLDQDSRDLTLVDLAKIESDSQEDGLRVAHLIRKKHPKIKIVGICDRENLDLLKEASEKGINKFVMRPVKNRELLEAIEN